MLGIDAYSIRTSQKESVKKEIWTFCPRCMSQQWLEVYLDKQTKCKTCGLKNGGESEETICNH